MTGLNVESTLIKGQRVRQERLCHQTNVDQKPKFLRWNIFSHNFARFLSPSEESDETENTCNINLCKLEGNSSILWYKSIYPLSIIHIH